MWLLTPNPNTDHLAELWPGKGFIKYSPKSSMSTWRHERKIVEYDESVVLLDSLVFESTMFAKTFGWLIRILFQNQLKNLVKIIGSESIKK